MLIAILPFGAGQFQNGSFLLGVAFLGAEGYALYHFYSKTQAATKIIDDTNAYTGAQDKVKMSTEEKASYETFLAGRRKYVADQQKSAQLGLIGFVGLWVLGAGEAILNDDSAPVAAKKKEPRKRRYSGFSYQLEPVVTPLAQDADGYGLGLKVSF